MKKYKVTSHNSTVCGFPGRDFDWGKFCWDGSEVCKTTIVSDRDYKAPLPFVDDYLIDDNCQYLHVPYNFAEDGTIYRVRPNESMCAGEVYRGKLIKKQTAVKEDGIWYWVLEL